MPRELRVARLGPGRVVALLAFSFTLLPSSGRPQSLTLLEVPFIAQSELLCGGAAAAMVMRYWGERGIDAEAFQPLIDRRGGGIRTDVLTSGLRARKWNAVAVEGSADALARELQRGRPVIALLEDHPRVYHYVVVVARSAGGVVFHDPARSPFRVSSVVEFDKRWAATNRWMLVVTPPASSEAERVATAGVDRAADATTRHELVQPLASDAVCDREIAEGVRYAQQNNFAEAERTLASAISCPGGAPLRELAGVRVLQRRWPEAADLASAALARDPSDTYASKLLATARFVTDDSLGALDAWNQASEPRIDLIRVDGLTRTRYQVVEHAIGLKTGTTLTRDTLLRARRRLNDFPAGSGTVDYVPLPSGLAEVRATVVERPLVPHGAFDLGVLALATSVTRELSTSISSLSGGGEQIGIDWRFWAHRPLYRLSIAAPAPWRGVWMLGIARERQPYTAVFAPTVHDALQIDAADWATGLLRWQVGAGLDRWNGARAFGSASAGVRFISGGDRFDARAQLRTWFGGGNEFEREDLHVVARSSPEMMGVVVLAEGGVAAVTGQAPPDLWPVGDTGRARPLLLRAHPILTEGERFRTERLARLFAHETTEVQRWWAVGPFRAGVATFVDTGRSARRVFGDPFTDVDVGFGMRGAYPGRAGALRLDVARGLRDGDTALSVIYTSAIP